MAMQAAISIGGALIGALASKALAPKDKQQAQPLLMEAPTTQQPEARQAAAGAAEQARKRASAGGRQSTMLTGSGSLGALDEKNKEPKTVLGY